MDYICGRIYMGIIQHACIGIEDGKIVEIKKVVERKAKDYGDVIILPSGIDVHVHFREPGYEYKEDFFTGSRAAAMAGITCVLDMPNNKPPILSKNAFNEKVRKIETKACIDYGLYAGIKERAYDVDCIAYKTFLSSDNEIFCSPEKIQDVLKEVKRARKPIAIHAEMEECIERRNAKNLEEHERNRKKDCEIMGIKEVLEINKDIGAKIHFCHVTLPEAVELINGKASFGSTLHHLLFSIQSKFGYQAMGKVNPPLRKEEERRRLYEMFVNGKIPILESDHAPHLLEEKENFEYAPSGMPGVGSTLPILLYMVKEGMLRMDVMLNLVCKKPAEFFGINKGGIEIGKDADFIVVDFSAENEIKPLSKCGWSAYEGMKCIYPKDVYLRGKKIVENYEFMGRKGMGKMIK